MKERSYNKLDKRRSSLCNEFQRESKKVKNKKTNDANIAA